jgi:hypothetical protein
MTNPRSVDEIIPELLAIIPNTEGKLISSIKSYRDSLWNKAPEILQSKEGWVPLAMILHQHVGVIDDDWKIKLQKVFNCEE